MGRAIGRNVAAQVWESISSWLVDHLREIFLFPFR
jgi:hypothetical protein